VVALYLQIPLTLEGRSVRLIVHPEIQDFMNKQPDQVQGRQILQRTSTLTSHDFIALIVAWEAPVSVISSRAIFDGGGVITVRRV
jgi:hypothetical protein